MAKINWGRVIVGGLLAGVVSVVLEFVLHSYLLAGDWASWTQQMGKSAESDGGSMVYFVSWSFLMGIFGVWLYAAVRPRFGAGPKTALKAGLALWVVGYALPHLVWAGFDVFSNRLVVIPVIEGLIEAPLMVLVGAWPYKEQPPA